MAHGGLPVSSACASPGTGQATQLPTACCITPASAALRPFPNPRCAGCSPSRRASSTVDGCMHVNYFAAVQSQKALALCGEAHSYAHGDTTAPTRTTRPHALARCAPSPLSGHCSVLYPARPPSLPLWGPSSCAGVVESGSGSGTHADWSRTSTGTACGSVVRFLLGSVIPRRPGSAA